MYIANPIYDGVFKFMMKDKKVAKLLLSAIIGKEIIELDFCPTEHQIYPKETLTVLRMDFAAKIKDKNGEESLILIELQKAKLSADIMRFRRYLGEQYSNKDNVSKIETNGEEVKKAFPILSIYFLGHKLEGTKVPVVKVARQYYDVATGEKLKTKEEFIESLTHDSFVIQIPFIQGRRRTELEQLLSIFDQTTRENDRHTLNINEDEVPKRYRSIVRRLLQAISDPHIRQTMIVEDEVIEELKDLERSIAKKDEIIEQKEKALEENEKVLEQKDKDLKQKDKAIEQKNKVLEDQKRLIEELKRKLDNEKK